MSNRPMACICLILIACTTAVARGADAPATITPEFGLLLSPGESSEERTRRRPPSLDTDPIRARLIDGTLASFQPHQGQTLDGQDSWQWKKVEFDEQGGVGQRGYYLYAPIVSDRARVLVLNAAGQSETYVNGLPRGGDLYNRGDVHVPIQVNEGTTSMFFRSGRGQLKVRLYEPPAPVFINTADMTLPDLVVGQPVERWGAVIIVNATTDPVVGWTLAVKAPGLKSVATRVPAIGPLSIRKAGFRLMGTAGATEGPLAAQLELHGPGGESAHSIALNLSVVGPTEAHKVTFVSEIDGSVQYYALRPAVPLSADDPAPAIVLSCHGASVEAIGQARAYSPRNWFHIVAPTNRRPYGYDWEDFGRMDAMEVLGLAQDTLKHDPSRIYLTGHSMGGHGTWHLGVTYPDRFAAIGPSAGWLSRSSYGRRGGD